MTGRSKRMRQSGFSMIELLIALVIVLINIMGVAGLVVKTVQQEAEAYQRVEALVILQDMVDRINANRQVASCYSNGATGVQLGKGFDATNLHDCGTSTAQEQAEGDLLAWHDMLLGTEAAEGTTNVGGMIGARGCITQVNALERIYRITVAWQGLSATTAPKAALTCGSGNYGDEKLRRVVTALVRIGELG